MIGGEPLAGRQPFLLVRARIAPNAFPRFIRWYYDTLRPHMLAIPGIVAAHRVVPPGEDSQWLRIFEFGSEGEIQGALESDEARRARDDWERWRDHVLDLSIEVIAPLGAATVLHHWN